MSSRLAILLHVLAGLALLLAGYAVGTVPGIAVHWHTWQKPLYVAGIIACLLAGLRRRQRLIRITARICLSLLLMLAVVTGTEALMRFVGFDFNRTEARLARLPPYYRIPMEPVDPVFFRRKGPAEWTGAVIRTQLKETGMDPTPYRDEPAVTVRYDYMGFRNDNRSPEWEIAIAGDSFVELGYLPFERLYTTLLGERLQLRVLNLGASYTGPLTHLKYLEDYGLSRSTRQIAVVFYEGNDLADLAREHGDLLDFERDGQRPVRQARRQTSFLRAVGEKWRNQQPVSDTPAATPINAVFIGRDGERPLSLSYRLEDGGELAPATDAALTRFFVGLSNLAKTHNVEAWLIYMPGKTRALEGRFRWTGSLDNLTSGVVARDLPLIIAGWCRRYSVRFLDLTPALTTCGTAKGELLYNDVFDTHLNAAGSAVVAGALAKALGTAGTPPVPPPESR